MATKTKSESRFVTQIVLVIVVVVGLVAGITFIAQYQPSRVSRGPEPPPPPPGTEVDLFFPRLSPEWDPPATSEFELRSPGWCDFWFKNKTGKTVLVSDVTKSCKCQSVQICHFTGDQQPRYLRWAAGSATSEIGIMTSGLTGLLPQMEFDRGAGADLRGAKVAWHDFQSGTDQVKIPPEASGIVRALWDGKRSKLGPERLTVTFYTQAQEESPTPRNQVQLEVPLVFVPPLRSIPATAEVGDIGLSEEKTAEFLVWSSTRAGFHLTANEKNNAPCFSCSVRPLNDEERSGLVEKSKGEPVRCGYAVQVRVRERQSDEQQMDLGPFTRRIILHPDGDIGEDSVAVSGTVRGEVIVGSEEERGRVDFRSFRVRTGASMSILVRGQVPGLNLRQEDLRVEPESLNYLKVRLEPAGKDRWKLQVEVPRDGPPGKLPEHSAVMLKIPTSPPRYIRVPIAGIAYQQ
jgi:hypothetical protein